MINQQLTLPVHLADETTFTNFFSSQNNEVVALLKSHIQTAQQAFFYLWGNQGVGKSHLLQASALYARELHRTSTYLSLAERALEPTVLEGLDDLSLVCIDDVENVLGVALWEEGLFNFYNAIRDKKHSLIVTATKPPRQLSCHLPDLKSRFSWGMVYHVQPLTDAEKFTALQLRATQRGITLSEEVSRFLLQRCARDMTSLYQILEKLDQASLRDKRALSIPFVKSVLDI